MFKTPRLLPVVIAAGTALLLLKGIGLVTNGGYVLTGTTQAVAAGDKGGKGATPAAAGNDPTMALPPEATMTDANPTLEDSSPELSLEPATGGEHGTSAPKEGSGHDAAPEEAQPLAGGPALDAACPPISEALEVAAGHGAEAPAAVEGEHGAEPAEGAAAEPDCMPIPVNEYGDAIALELNDEGVVAPVVADEGSKEGLIERLGERRTSLDAREKELEMRLALVEAAEKRLEERTQALQAIEARIDALVEQKKADEQQQFAGIVAMYETMKPKEAATIFNTLDNEVLLRVTRAMNPRKMAPILARMETLKAKTLTAGLARQEAEPTIDAATVEDLANLPQIVGQ